MVQRTWDKKSYLEAETDVKGNWNSTDRETEKKMVYIGLKNSVVYLDREKYADFFFES